MSADILQFVRKIRVVQCGCEGLNLALSEDYASTAPIKEIEAILAEYGYVDQLSWFGTYEITVPNTNVQVISSGEQLVRYLDNSDDIKYFSSEQINEFIKNVTEEFRQEVKAFDWRE